MDSPNNWGDQAPIRHLSSPNEVSIVRNRLHLIELLTKEVPWEPESDPDNCQGGGSIQIGGKALFLMTPV